MTAPTDPLLAGTAMVGGYRIEHHLGAGGMGTVYAAVEPTIGKRVAVKVLRADLTADDTFVARFEREAKSVAQLRHPAVIEIFAFGRLEDGRPYFVMPLLVGRSVREEIDRRGRLELEEAWRIGREIASGLAAAHATGVLHRDLKPDNVFLAELAGRATQPVLLDFGLAKIAAGSDPDEEGALAKLTGTGVPLGTPLYMAPEQWWASPATHATDQYGLGCVLFEMLTGRPPFEGTRYPELLEAHLHRPPPRAEQAVPEVGRDVGDFVERLLAKAPEGRFPTFEDLIQAGDRAFAAATAAAPTRRAEPPAKTPAASAEDPAVAHTEPSLAALPARRGRNELRRWATYLGSVLAVIAVLPAVGYPGEGGRDVLLWLRSIGFGFIPILLATAVAMLSLPLWVARARTRPGFGLVALALVVAPAFLALLPLYLGWKKVVSHLGPLSPSQAFELMHMGYYELSAAGFLGLGLTAGLGAGIVVLVNAELGEGALCTPRRAVPSWLALGAGVLGVAALGVGWTSPGLLMLGCAILFASLRWRPAPAPELAHLEVDRALGATASMLAMVGVALTRLEAEGASAFAESISRAARVSALIRLEEQRTLLAWTGLLCLGLAAAFSWSTYAGAARDVAATRAQRARLPWSGLIAGGAIALLTLVEVQVQRDFASRREVFVGLMKDQLVFFAKLVPPGAAEQHDLPAPSPTVAIQISAEAVAVNGEGVGRLAALDAQATRQAVVAKLTSALASPAAGADASGADLSLLVDRSVPLSRLRQLCAIAFDAGARSAEVLLTRGPLVSVPAGAPPEAGYLLPRDFVAFRVKLERGSGQAPQEGVFEELAREFQTRDGGEIPVLLVGP